MKIFALSLCFFCNFISIGQKSYYFSDPLPSRPNGVQQIDERCYGRYVSSNNDLVYEVGTEGIRIVSTNISFIDRATIRESSKYDVRNNFIFGVVDGDSLPCVLKDDRYYFGVRNRDMLIGAGMPNILVKISSSEYVVNYFENELYTPAIFKFTSGQLEVRSFDYDIDTEIFDGVNLKRTIPREDPNVVVLSPSEEEFEALREAGILEISTIYKKEIE
ncbi:MAG: hypothetical protein A3D92_02580 [Bacteroidetes bacterium RIFCSPHIGHO2_02_FULL_44_7]|nr:MAG: hypothetical protein A3D92_02580 [Bacteroidetes bacterium RIFCSPHIGHO2_02_FULL_44_7]